jgi:hypothetical protein
MCNSIPANLTSKVCNGNGNFSYIDNCDCNNGFIGKYCENNCNSLYYYIDLAKTLNETLKHLTIKNEENELLLKSLTQKNLENENLNKNLI